MGPLGEGCQKSFRFTILDVDRHGKEALKDSLLTLATCLGVRN
jgi:hypothetical protein